MNRDPGAGAGRPSHRSRVARRVLERYRLRLSRREQAWQTAQILILRHQLAVVQRRQPRRPNVSWADRALLTALPGVIPKPRRPGLRLLVTADTIVRWHRGIAGRRSAAESLRGT